ncbi:YqaE/Pmp3 family membrane protein [Virgibacillus sp. 7505]|uniref:YqaE/Pmp3 family membrane protein n=1 Tax=Virgibacillus sp. 7505 TaxID=2022548 RepID=UPI00256FB276|nr:YqaE/Pmp3 family membrane protein [Virgibacillus sp. 7505]
MYLLAIVLPPVAVLFTGKPFKALLNLVLTLIFFVPGAVHAALIVKIIKIVKNSMLEKAPSNWAPFSYFSTKNTWYT